MPRTKALILDTNVILRFLLNDVPELYVKAEQIFRQVEEGKVEVLLTDLVLSECVWVLEKFYRAPRQEIAEKLSLFIQTRGILTNTPKPVLTAALSTWSGSALDWTDALLVAKASHGNTKLITFDREIAKNFPGLVSPT